MSNNIYNKYHKYKAKYNQLKKIIRDIESSTQLKPIKAIGYFDGSMGNIVGNVLFEEVIESSENLVKVLVNLTGFAANSIHGFHVHETGDLSEGCDSMCAHLNPFNTTHGGRTDVIRHVGDLGNITADKFGNVNMEFTDGQIKLRGLESNIIGRGLIIHADHDDCGKGINSTSKTTGNSGKRIACTVIGYAKNMSSYL
jgi:Cu-Zn family superoxide dismutase